MKEFFQVFGMTALLLGGIWCAALAAAPGVQPVESLAAGLFLGVYVTIQWGRNQ